MRTIGKRLATALILIATTAALHAQTNSEQSDSVLFKGTLRNAEFEVMLHVNLYGQDVKVPGQELYGELAGYLQRDKTSFCWLITSATVGNRRTAHIEMVNDYGSEDLTAELTADTDSTFTLRQLSGSALKVPKNGKWLKLPKVMQFRKMKDGGRGL